MSEDRGMAVQPQEPHSSKGSSVSQIIMKREVCLQRRPRHVSTSISMARTQALR